MITNKVGVEVIKSAINGIKGFKTSCKEAGSLLCCIFKKGDYEIVFYLSLANNCKTTCKIFRCSQPITDEMAVLNVEAIRLYFELTELKYEEEAK